MLHGNFSPLIDVAPELHALIEPVTGCNEGLTHGVIKAQNVCMSRLQSGGRMRSIYVISDLHLGGEYPVPPEPGKRGFRLCTRADAVAQFIDSLTQNFAHEGPSELVLNGDTVDFLAEGDEKPNTWSPFTGDPSRAVAKFEAIVKRDLMVFQSLERFLSKGGRLVVLLGNHDIELSLPAVRVAFRRALGVKAGHDFEFLYDGEAYIVGDALIEHGNRYDAWNQIDYDALRRVRSFQSRRQDIPDEYNFTPPAGSEMVTSVINTIKLQYPFVDLLKPETAAVVPMLLALEPGYRNRLATVAALAYQTLGHGLAGPATPKFGGNISALKQRDAPFGKNIGSGGTFRGSGAGATMLAGSATSARSEASAKDDSLTRALQSALGNDAEGFLRNIDAEVIAANPLQQIGSPISRSDTVNRVLGFAALLLGRKSESVEKRLPALLKAMRGIQDEDTFDTAKESATEYLEAAHELADRGFRYVIFGHTHQAKQVDLGNGRFYLNSGTWADVLRFPVEILKSRAEAPQQLQTFVDQMKAGDFSKWTIFNPTYVRLDLDDADKVVKAELKTFSEVKAPPV
jgi:UDP-2,3-diacylglucosamine pyrophosphatase LpxH